ncbi:MAG: hypothetical protein L3J66_00510 [Bacteroidales bacterium]|nr:hypothetical protein [Bacteroidales bacterium]
MEKANQSEVLLFGETYHIYNKTVGNELMFKTENDYQYFLNKLTRFILPISNIYAYCLMPNHFHLLLGIKERNTISNLLPIENERSILRKFTNFFISYSKSFNKVHQRQGRLLLQSFKRILVEDGDYFTSLINYIHRNPIHHGMVTNYVDWKYSSYNAFLSDNKTSIDKTEVLAYFDSLEDFVTFHEENRIKPEAEKYYLE